MTFAVALSRPLLVARARAHDGPRKKSPQHGFKRRFEAARKRFDALSTKLGDAHKRNLEKVDLISKDDVELAKELFKDDDDEDDIRFTADGALDIDIDATLDDK